MDRLCGVRRARPASPFARCFGEDLSVPRTPFVRITSIRRSPPRGQARGGLRVRYGDDLPQALEAQISKLRRVGSCGITRHLSRERGPFYYRESGDGEHVKSSMDSSFSGEGFGEVRYPEERESAAREAVRRRISKACSRSGESLREFLAKWRSRPQANMRVRHRDRTVLKVHDRRGRSQESGPSQRRRVASPGQPLRLGSRPILLAKGNFGPSRTFPSGRRSLSRVNF